MYTNQERKLNEEVAKRKMQRCVKYANTQWYRKALWRFYKYIMAE